MHEVKGRDLDDDDDITIMSDASKHAGAKPRLSLFSSKQAVIRVKSDDPVDETAANVPVPEAGSQANRTEPQHTGDLGQNPDPDKETRLIGNTQNDLNKMNISKEDLLRLLSILKSELQSKEIALAAIKCEQLKRLINPIEISRSSLANTYMKLQDHFKKKDRNNNTKEKLLSKDRESTEQQEQQQLVDRDRDEVHSGDDIDEENLNILIALLELLDRHPLLALPRDSIYCLDYNCNELSTKNYLNLKIQHLDDLIDQHRRFRYSMTNKLKRSEQRLLEVTTQLEYERSLMLESGKTIYGTNGDNVLLKRIEEVREALEKEKREKQVIVMTLLNELLDEKERASSLSEQLAKSKTLESNETSDEREKLQSELSAVKSQSKKQASTFACEREEMLSKIASLKKENEGLRYRLEQSEKRPTPSPKPQQETKETNCTTSPSSPSKATGSSRSVNSSSRPQANVNSPTATMRATKLSPQTRSSNSPNSFNSATTAQSNSVQQRASPPVRQTSQSSVNTRTTQAKSPGASPGTGEQQSIARAQPLLKSASVLSTYQQTRSQRASISNNQLVRSTSTTQASITKPQVPAKPAQLLDQQRGSQ